MKTWQEQLEKRLSERDAPAVLTRNLLERFARSALVSPMNGDSIPKSSLSYRIRQLTDAGKLEPVQRGIYLNRLRRKPVSLADAVPSLQRDAVVSLNTVLGDAGVLNNPSRIVTAVAPINRGAPPPSRLGRRKTKAGTVHFFGIPRDILEAGKPEDRLEPIEAYDHVRATPEKALIDWLYLGFSPRSRRTLPPRGDIDMDMLDSRRLVRLAKAARLTEELDAWKAGNRP